MLLELEIVKEVKLTKSYQLNTKPFIFLDLTLIEIKTTQEDSLIQHISIHSTSTKNTITYNLYFNNLDNMAEIWKSNLKKIPTTNVEAHFTRHKILNSNTSILRFIN